MSAGEPWRLHSPTGEDAMAGGDRCLRIRRSRALVDERRAEEDGEAHRDASRGGCGVRGGSVGRVDGGGGV